MTDLKTPFLRYDNDSDTIHLEGKDISGLTDKKVETKVNAAVASREKAAAVKALREAADAENELATMIELNLLKSASHYRRYPAGKPGHLQSAREKRESAIRLNTRADQIEKGDK